MPNEQMNKQENQRYIDAASKTLKDHVYTNLCNTDELKVWRCKRPHSSCYAFDIMMTRYGIAIVGDIDSLTFRVGIDYGMGFLAGSDINYYIHSKLDDHCKKTEVDESKILDFCVSNWLSPLQELVAGWLDDIEDEELKQAQRNEFIETLSDYGIDRKEFESWSDESYSSGGIASISMLANIFRAAGEVELLCVYVDKQKPDFTFYEIRETISDLEDMDAEAVIYDRISRAPEGDCELSDWSFTKPSDWLYQELYMINHAAKAIVNQQEKARKSSRN